MIERVGVLLDVLAKSNLVVLPVVKQGFFAGMVMRRALIYALTKTRYFATYDDALRQQEFFSEYSPGREMETLASSTSANDFSFRVPNVPVQHHNSYVNLTPFVDAGAFSAQPDTPTTRVQQLFRRVGSSHLCVTDLHNHVLGVITRRDLLVPRRRKARNSRTLSGQPVFGV